MSNDVNPEADNWRTDTMDCAICNHEWVAVYPDGTPRLECPGCGYYNGSPTTEPSQNQEDQ